MRKKNLFDSMIKPHRASFSVLCSLYETQNSPSYFAPNCVTPLRGIRGAIKSCLCRPVCQGWQLLDTKIGWPLGFD